jgi:hypothetical protein
MSCEFGDLRCEIRDVRSKRREEIEGKSGEWTVVSGQQGVVKDV